MNKMECKQWLNWFMFAVICPLITGAPSSLFHESCPTADISIINGSFVLSNEYSHGSILRYSCPKGFYPSIKTRRCQNGSWDPKITKKPAQCKKVTCPDPGVFENGKVSPYQTKYYFNDKTTYSCHSDYTFRGSEQRICKPNGKWSGSTPICGRDSDHCPDPGVPPGSYRSKNTFNIDDKVTYSCENKLTLIGSKHRVCQEGGQWSGTEPQCYADFTFDTPEEASEAFSGSLKTNLVYYKQYEETDQAGKKIRLDKGGKLDIYIAVDASDSIQEEDFNKTKEIIETLINAISFYEVSPNYEILMFATDVTPIVSMRDFKTSQAENKLEDVLSRLKNNYTHETKGDRSGTNIAKAYHRILDSMGVEKARDKESFLLTQQIVIMFTDGYANMGGSPRPKVEQIKHMVTQNDPTREDKLDLYVFGVGKDLKKEELNEFASKRDKEFHVFLLSDLDEVQEMLDQMIDESSSVGLCGIQHEHSGNRRRAFPWLAQIKTKSSTTGSLNCMGSLVTPSYILTAAHCFKSEKIDDIISIQLTRGPYEKAKRVIIHPDYNINAKKHIGIPEYYEFDVALIQLEKAVKLDQNLRPICIPCTKETSGALKILESEATCKKHEDIIMGSDLVNADFTSEMMLNEDNTPHIIRSITIKQRGMRDACVKDALQAKEIKDSWNKSLNAEDIVTKNFLCSGGTNPTTDHISCKGDSGGATYLHKNKRVIQVGIVSWGTKNICMDNTKNVLSDKDSRDYHTNLFGPKIRSFLEKHLGDANETNGAPLTFLAD